MPDQSSAQNEPTTSRQKSISWIINIVAFLFVLTMNYLANALPLGGQSTGSISDKYPTLFTPAGFTFSIWGIIYLGLSAFIVYQALVSNRQNPLLTRIHPPFQLNCLANGLWLIFWHYDMLWFSLFTMFFILGTLIVIYVRLREQNEGVTFATGILVMIPFSIYLGWITVATIANISIVQYDMGWNDIGLNAINWTLIKIGAAGAIGTWMLYRSSDIAYILVIAWASFGIMSKQSATPDVAGAAGMLVGLCMAAITIYLIRMARGQNVLKD